MVEDARLLVAAAGLAGCRAGAAAARGLRAAVLVVPLALEAAPDGALALAVAGRALAFAFGLVLLVAGAARRAAAAAGLLAGLVARVPRAATLPAAAVRGAALRRLVAGAAFLPAAEEAGLRSAFAGRAPRAGVCTATLRAVVVLGAAALPARDGAAVPALPLVGVVAPRALRAAVEEAAFPPAAAGLLRAVDADGRRPGRAASGRVLLGGALLPGRLAMITSETSGQLASNRFA
ncbi:hypothetical protein [Muricoccus vinaceus]|uniref:Uncharacterized protein n=1 Tax=Muricoccus vinaceus TaxID=424704 RepID=A0ABV6IXZ4_9PROT